MTDAPIISRVVSPEAMSRRDQEMWRAFLAPRPLAFLSHSYVRAIASCVPLVRVSHIMQGGRTVAFFPFQYRSRAHLLAGIGQCLGGEASDYFGLVAAAGFRIEPAALLRLSGLKSLFFTQLDESQQGHGLFGAPREIGHIIDLPEGGTAFWKKKACSDKKLVQDTERRERNLVREYGQLSFAYSDADGEGSLDRLIAEKRAQFRRTGVKDVLRSRQVRAILHALRRTDDPQCTGVISTLYAGDTWVASHFGLQAGSTLHYWFPVYNPLLKAFSPGRILLKQIILGAQCHGLSLIDRGAGDSIAKRDFSTSQHVFNGGLWQRQGVSAFIHRIGFAIEWRLSRCFH